MGIADPLSAIHLFGCREAGSAMFDASSDAAPSELAVVIAAGAMPES